MLFTLFVLYAFKYILPYFPDTVKKGENEKNMKARERPHAAYVYGLMQRTCTVSCMYVDDLMHFTCTASCIFRVRHHALLRRQPHTSFVYRACIFISKNYYFFY